MNGCLPSKHNAADAPIGLTMKNWNTAKPLAEIIAMNAGHTKKQRITKARIMMEKNLNKTPNP